TTTLLRPARRAPSLSGAHAPPAVKPPPWIQTMTGSCVPGRAGDQTVACRQSSAIARPSSPNQLRPTLTCGADTPGPEQSRQPVHGGAASGGRNRSGPTGGTPNGTPRNAATPASTQPFTSPREVRLSASRSGIVR